ncbi:protein CLMP1 [Phoenix dactylifera]|uniref:Protein CLMP1 n=1 Tax=Phoenix dactylifera TaxID=42345 RepID=A0A8B7CPF6_PHODC|nr:protein CLMP1 [Phoenix dactylifera]
MGKSGGRKKKGGGNPATGQPSPAGTTPAAAPNGGGAHVPDAPALLRRAHELKEEGNRLFQARDYVGAVQQYDLALKLTPRGHPDRAIFHSNRAACLMQMRPVDHEAVAAECSLALQAQPRFPRALLRRARALDALRRPELALQDVQTLLEVDPSNSDALDLARRLRPALSSASASASLPPDLLSRPSPAALGASAVRTAAPIAGLGPCLPARPVPKKSSPPPTPARPPVTPSNNHHQQQQRPPSSLLLPNGPRPKSPPKPAAATEASSGLDNNSGSQKQLQRSVGKESSLDSAGTAAAVLTRWRPLKLVYDHDIRLARMPAKCSFKTLREVVANRFPSSKSVLIKYKDAEGDLVTITSSVELRLAESCADQLAPPKDSKESPEINKDEKLQALRLHIVDVIPEQEPSLPQEEDEEEEEKPVEDEGLTKVDESLSHSSAGDSGLDGVDNEVMKTDQEKELPKESGLDGKKECDHAECKEVEIDDWLFDFAQLFRNQVGIDPDAHLDLHELGMELCSEALEETVTSEEAQRLFEMAAAKFQEVAALAFFNWGNVHMCAARKRIPLDESSPKEVLAAQLQTAYDWVRERYALAGQKYEEALRIKPDFYEGLLALGQQHFETAKLHWSFALANKIDLSTWDPGETINLFNSAEEKMKAATEMWEKVEEQRIIELKDPGMSKKDELLKRRKKQGVLDGQGELSADEAAEQAAVMRSQIHLFWGNMLFERSQVEFKLGVGDWKKNLDAAVERFKLAGASEAEISVVLKNHSSNVAGVESDEGKGRISSNGASETNVKDEDNSVLEN